MAALPMSDRRFMVGLTGLLTALLGIALVVLALVGLQDPVVPSGEIGAPTDVSRLLTSTVALGVLLALAGGLTAVRAMRPARRGDEDGPGEGDRPDGR